MFHLYVNSQSRGKDADAEALKRWCEGDLGDTLVWSIPDSHEYEGNMAPVWWQTVTPDGSYVEIVKCAEHVIPR